MKPRIVMIAAKMISAYLRKAKNANPLSTTNDMQE